MFRLNNVKSSTAPLVSETFHKTSFSGQAFHCSAPITWNSLLNTVTAADSLASFKSRLKTHLINQIFRPTRSHAINASEITTLWRFIN